MSFRCPSDAQAKALRTIIDHDADIWWFQPGENVYGASYACLLVEIQDRDRNSSHYDNLAYHRGGDRVRVTTIKACIRHGWLTIASERVYASGIRMAGVYRSAKRTPDLEVVHELRPTDDGELALGLWRERKLNAPLVALPVLDAGQRTLLTLAAQAEALGFALLPKSDAARLACRGLARTPYAVRGFGAGAGTRSIKPTALGEVEALPETADRPDEPERHAA